MLIRISKSVAIGGRVAGIVLLLAATAPAAESDVSRLADDLRPLLACLSGERERFTITGDVRAHLDDQPQEIAIRLVRFGDDSFDVDLKLYPYTRSCSLDGDARMRPIILRPWA